MYIGLNASGILPLMLVHGRRATRIAKSLFNYRLKVIQCRAQKRRGECMIPSRSIYAHRLRRRTNERQRIVRASSCTDRWIRGSVVRGTRLVAAIMELAWRYTWFLYTHVRARVHIRPFYTYALTSIRNVVFAVLVSSQVNQNSCFTWECSCIRPRLPNTRLKIAM